MSNRSTAPSPYVFPPSQSFLGNDGLWSTFIMRIGSPAQDFRVLPSTNSDNIVIPVTEGCTDDEEAIPPALCGSLRGAMPFNNRGSSGFMVNGSTTWKNIGIFSLPLGQQWGIQGQANYGYDTVGLAVQNSGGPTLDGQVVAGIAMEEFLMGFFPLGSRPTNFSTFDNPQPSYLEDLQKSCIIPGLGFGYTAGAHYQYTGVTGNLVLGGYDQSRLNINNSKTFTFGHDDRYSFLVGIQNIVATNTPQGTISPLTDGIIASIDSTLPYLWLPSEVCDRFQAAFGLTYDSDSQLYVVNDTTHAQLKKLNPSVSLTLGSGTTSGAGKESAVVITLPYAAFDLQASWPIMENTTNYFPLKRAFNSTQYTLGRTFLQEAYLSVDYTRRVFNVSQALFANPMPAQQIVSMQPELLNTNSPNPSHLSTASEAGIAVGVASAAILAALLGIFCHKRRRRRAAIAMAQETALFEPASPPPDTKEVGDGEVYEAHGDARPCEAESDDSQRYEMPGEGRPVEMAQGSGMCEMGVEGRVYEML